MNTIVEVNGTTPVAGTKIIAEGFNRKHSNIVKNIQKYKSDFKKLGDLKSRSFKTGGKAGTEYLLNEEQVMLLGTYLRNTPEVRTFKINLVKQFLKMKKVLMVAATQRQSSNWVEARAEGKEIRHLETDIIKDFIMYAKHQGSGHADRYHMIFTKLIHDKLFELGNSVNWQNKRELMSAQQLADVCTAERVIKRGLLEGMALGLPYKQIYKDVRDRVESLGTFVGRTLLC